MNLKNNKHLNSSYFRGKNHFENDGTQNYLIFQPMQRYFKKIGSTDHISESKSRGLPDEIIKPLSRNNNSLIPKLSYVSNRIRVKFHGS